MYVPLLCMIDDLASFKECGADFVKVNALINAKIETKKLEFAYWAIKWRMLGSEGSCYFIDLKSYETYLGDIVCNSEAIT